MESTRPPQVLQKKKGVLRGLANTLLEGRLQGLHTGIRRLLRPTTRLRNQPRKVAAHSSAGAGSVHVPRACERDEPNKQHEGVCRSHAPRVADLITWRGGKLFGFGKLKRLGANEKYCLPRARQRGSKCRNGPTRFPFPAALYPRHVSARCVRRRIGHSFMCCFDGECTQHQKNRDRRTYPLCGRTPKYRLPTTPFFIIGN